MEYFGDLIERLRILAKQDREEAAEAVGDPVFAPELEAAAIAMRVLTDERDGLLRRLQHLFQSATICKYDEKRGTGEYRLDIADLDKKIEERDALYGRIAELEEKFERACMEKNEPCSDVCCDDRSEPEPLYICDRRACDTCYPECKHTKDLRHAKHFEASECRNLFVEQEAI